MEYLEIIAKNGHILNFSYKNWRGLFTLDLNNAVEMFSISDFKRFFAIAEESADGVFTIAEKVFSFVSCRLEYEKSFLGGTFSKNQKMIARLEKILLFLADSFGISCDVEKPEKITKKRGTGLIFNIDASGRRYAEAVTGDFYKVGGIWYFIHKKPEIKRGGYVLSAAAYGSRVAAFGYFKTAKDAIAWITENGISQKLLNPPAEGRTRAAEMRARFLDAVENSGLSWVIEQNPAFFEDFLTTEAEKTAEKTGNAPTECAIPATDTTPTKDPATPAWIITDRPQKPTTARIDRATHHKPHIKPKMQHGYISTIDSVKAFYGAKYAPTMARPTPAFSIGFQKMDFQGLEKGCFDQKGKIAWFSVKNRFGFCIGLSPPLGAIKKFCNKLLEV